MRASGSDRKVIARGQTAKPGRSRSLAGARILTARLHCPTCKGNLREAAQAGLVCAACGEIIPLIDGIADFVRSRHDTVLDVASYDQDHGVSDATSDRYY